MSDLVVALPFELDEVVRTWSSLRSLMIRHRPPDFERDEWAYLISFLDEDHLRAPFRQTFAATPAGRAARPRGLVAVWLPNNVSLLGPLILVLLSLTGNPLRLKAGSDAKNLTGELLRFALEHLPKGALRGHLEANVRVDVFGHEDARHREMAANARVRIVFGSDEAARAVAAIGGSNGRQFSFVDRQSEAWVDAASASDEVLDSLAKVFAIYGQAGCTSPRRVVVIDGTADDARALRDRLLDRWPRIFPGPPAPHVASTGILARQWAAALGWDARATLFHHAVLSVGDYALQHVPGERVLSISPAPLERALAGLPANIQTVGHAASDVVLREWLPRLAATRALRVVPIGEMHHFGHVWDGEEYWRACFDEGLDEERERS
jgi:hypothetical protein